MKVLVACEFSGVVRDAFVEHGHDAVSCDVIPSEKPGPHIQDDVLKHLDDGWDMMIAHPPCTYLANSGVSWLVRGGVIDQKRWGLMEHAAEFFHKMWSCDIKRICIENPVMHGYAKHEAGMAYCYDSPEYKQVIQPWMFGHPEKKATCLWLKALPKLIPTNNVYDKMVLLPKNKQQRLHYLPPSETRQKERSRTFKGIATAMADQWGSLDE